MQEYTILNYTQIEEQKRSSNASIEALGECATGESKVGFNAEQKQSVLLYTVCGIYLMF